VSLYRTWRPATFADLVGQDAVVKTLRTALTRGRLAHAYLFSGPRGSGKTSAAKILARCVNCVLGPTPEPDNTCANCQAILAGSALDVIELDAASNRGIDQIRELRDSAQFAPAQMRMKVFILDEAHMLTREGSNAFLKTLEEPPAHVLFILATTAPESLFPTILSRCQRYAFRSIAVPTMIERMRTIARAEGIPIDDGALAAIAYRADGGLRDALTMLEQVAAFADGPVDETVVDAAFGSTGRDFARTLVSTILAGDAAGALHAIDAASEAGTEMLTLIRGGVAEYRHLLVARIAPDLLASELSPDDARRARDLAATATQTRIVRGLRLLGEAVGASRLSGNPRLELESAVLRLVAAGEDTSTEGLAHRVAQLEERLGGAGSAPAGHRPEAPSQPASESQTRPVPAPAPPRPSEAEPRRASAAPPERAPGAAPPGASTPATPSPARSETTPQPDPPSAQPAEPSPAKVSEAPAKPAAEALFEPPANGGPPTLQRIKSAWRNVRTRAESERRSLAAALARTRIGSLEGDVLVLVVPDDMADFLRSHIGILEKAIADVLGTALHVRVVVDRPGGGSGGPSLPPPDDAPSGGDELGLLEYAAATLGGER
jgi:DNA polymerase-3 subunit gamma/tau